MTVTVHNNDQLNAVLAAMRNDAPTHTLTAGEVQMRQHAAAEQASSKDAKAAVQQQKAKEQTESPKGEEAQSSAPTQTVSDNSAISSNESEANNDDKAATYEDAKKAILTLSKEKGRQASVDALSRFGVEKLPDLSKERYADLVKLVGELMAGAEV